MIKTGMKKLVLIVLLSTFLPAACDADVAGRINAVLNKAAQKGVRFAVQVVKADSGKSIYTRNAASPMLPASNMKIIVTAAALKLLGADYQYNTKVGLCGDTLVVIGSGDPLLGDEVTDKKHGRKKGWIFADIAEKLKVAGITTVRDIIIDSTVFDDSRVHPNWPADQLNQWYACEVSGLNFNDNCIAITTKNVSGRVEVIVQPRTNFVKIINKVRAVSNSSGGVGAYRNHEPNIITVAGKCKKQQGPFPVAIERPAAFFGYVLAEKLVNAGISTTGQLFEKKLPTQCEFKVIGEYRTPIADCLARSNKNSLGLVAEALLKTLAAKATPGEKNGSWQGGREVISKFLTDLGVKEDEFYIDDGSGLSRKNRLSANALTKVLLDVYRSGSWRLYRESLAVGGVDGTIRRRFREAKYRGKICGKTGYIRGVKSLSGICSTDNGPYIFAILANTTSEKPHAAIDRTAIDGVVKAIIDANARKAPKRQ